jgi:hypothetical protein
MTQYLLSVHTSETDEAAMSEDLIQRLYQQVDDFNEKVRAAGAWVFAGGLEPIEAATTVDGTKPEPVVTDGPFAESKEYLGGFWVIEAPDLDAALTWAKEGSAACQGIVEVRPFQDEPA